MYHAVVFARTGLFCILGIFTCLGCTVGVFPASQPVNQRIIPKEQRLRRVEYDWTYYCHLWYWTLFSDSGPSLILDSVFWFWTLFSDTVLNSVFWFWTLFSDSGLCFLILDSVFWYCTELCFLILDSVFWFWTLFSDTELCFMILDFLWFWTLFSDTELCFLILDFLWFWTLFSVVYFCSHSNCTVYNS